MLGHMSLCLSPGLTYEARTNIGLSRTIGFLNEKDSLANVQCLENCRQVYLLLFAFSRL